MVPLERIEIQEAQTDQPERLLASGACPALFEVSRGHQAKGCSLGYCWSASGTGGQFGLLRNPEAGPDGCSWQRGLQEC